MIQAATAIPGGLGIPDGAQVEVRVAKDAPLGERIAQIRKHLQESIQEAVWVGKVVQPDASVFVGIFLLMEELTQRVEALEGEGDVPEEEKVLAQP